VVVGLATFELHLNGCQSLKDKRRILKSLKDRLQNRFNVSVAETDHHDQWQRAELACCVVSTEQRHAASVLSSVDQFIAGIGLVRIIDSTTNYL
jgi:uncharacterized protein YlxP (DUF503 family)